MPVWRCRSSFLLYLLVACASRGSRDEAAPVGQAVKAPVEALAAWLDQARQDPDELVLASFAQHDVVFLGEHHWFRQDLLFLQGLLPRLYESGIRVLVTEHARLEDADRIAALITAQTYDEAEARRLTRLAYPLWGYQEYVDVFHAAWELNRGLPEGAPPFRILGVAIPGDPNLFHAPEDLEDPQLRHQYWADRGEDRWAQVVLDEVAQGHKVLVFAGINHALTRYRQPISDEGRFIRFVEDRMGNHVYDAIGDRAITLFLHSPWTNDAGEAIPPGDGVLDRALRQMDPGRRRAAFDTRGTPLGALQDHGSTYRHGYPSFSLGDFCDGWISLAPLDELQVVTVIDDFIDARSILEVHAQDYSWDRDTSAATYMGQIYEMADHARQRVADAARQVDRPTSLP